mmetsp:Transcript_18619/g.57249  ORF Transcript_18619/g.57249 Transcript_18619/m.57249 type:complete len:245 (+) Transcript_18619:711-1445(+)
MRAPAVANVTGGFTGNCSYRCHTCPTSNAIAGETFTSGRRPWPRGIMKNIAQAKKLLRLSKVSVFPYPRQGDTPCPRSRFATSPATTRQTREARQRSTSHCRRSLLWSHSQVRPRKKLNLRALARAFLVVSLEVERRRREGLCHWSSVRAASLSFWARRKASTFSERPALWSSSRRTSTLRWGGRQCREGLNMSGKSCLRASAAWSMARRASFDAPPSSSGKSIKGTGSALLISANNALSGASS